MPSLPGQGVHALHRAEDQVLVQGGDERESKSIVIEDDSADGVELVEEVVPATKKRRAEAPRVATRRTAVVTTTVPGANPLPGFPKTPAHLQVNTRRCTSAELKFRPEIGPTPLGFDCEAAGLDSPNYDTLPRDEKELLWDVADGVDLFNIGAHKLATGVPKLAALRSVRNLAEYGLVAGPSKKGKEKAD
ncbi:hypothetical protein SCHPADRAFT_948221 [Schizopora paradoxa]|uniref:Uncharacterized protein n=1 Tax=Schizopora paradoxa TaxID=27342 RepID=A0A0H2QX18_9AGAM|nr:hypothetical protein SCHPADRAFT_948221 [Schizopora paradoxa]